MLRVSLEPEFPEKLIPLFEPAPYKVIEGGRGKGATWGFARAALILGLKRKLFIVCGREIQKSIDESVKKALEEQIVALRLHAHTDERGRRIPARYTVYDNEIVGSNGTRFVFVGVRNDINKVRSMEGIDIFWMAEARRVSQYIWDILMPTVRGDPPKGPFGQGSEIWIDLNPELVDDYSYQFWVIDPPPGTVVIHMSWRDNPWFPERLHQQMIAMKERDYESYLTVFEGQTRKTVEGAIYAKELKAALEDDPPRIGPHWKLNPTRPFDLSFDLGRADTMAMGFWQQTGTDHLLGDYYANVGCVFSDFVKEANERKYIIRRVYLPHDADNEVVQTRKSVAAQARDAWPSSDGSRVVVVKVPKRKVLAINAVRSLFPRILINDYKAADLVTAITHYQYGVNPETLQRTQEPLHNWASHGADMVATYALGLRQDESKINSNDDEAERTRSGQGNSLGWMAA